MAQKVNGEPLPATSSAASEKLWNSNYCMAMTSNFLLFFAFYILTPLLPIYLDAQFAADKHMMGFVLSGYVVACLLVRPFSGFIVDSFDRRKVLLCCFSFSSYASSDMWGPAL